jgi:protein-tyrosine phosphatase
MIPLVDIHCHLLAGLDDGPQTEDEALAMCRMAFQEGTRVIAATAHQNERWPDVTPDAIRSATALLSKLLHEKELPLTVHPCAEIMVNADLPSRWQSGQLLSIADHGRYVLIELPHGLFLDLRDLVRHLCRLNVRPILAHPERQGEILHSSRIVEELIACGCLIQVSSSSLVGGLSREGTRALKEWVRRGMVHLLGSDGHSVGNRAPRMKQAYQSLIAWAGDCAADRIASTNGLAVFQGLPLKVPHPLPRKRRWFARR